MSELKDFAIRYVKELNWYVFPTIEKGGKKYTDRYGLEQVTKPKMPYTTYGFMEATQDIAKIEEWWKKWPNAGIGISCGHSNLVTMDIDVKNNPNALDIFYSLGISDEGCLHALTPSGGSHIVYSGLSNTSSNKPLGLDIRSKGAYFLAPPSKIYNDDGSIIGSYIAIEDWFEAGKNITKIPDDFLERMHVLRDDKPIQRADPKTYEKDVEKLRERCKVALDKLAEEKPYMAEDYFFWLKVGMALYDGLGDAGFDLWVQWSQTCEKKFDYSICEYKWKTFKPREISLGSLFYWAWEEETIEI